MGAARGAARRPRRPRRDPRAAVHGSPLADRHALALEVGEGQAPAVAELLRRGRLRRGRDRAGPRRDRARRDRSSGLAHERDGLDRARWGRARARGLERCIAGGGVAVFPADGLYGLACDPLNAEAIARIHRIKGRDDGKPSAVIYFSPLAMRELVESLGERTRAAVGGAAARPGDPRGRQPRASLSACLPRGSRAVRACA